MTEKTKGARKIKGTDIETFEEDIDYILHRPQVWIGSCVETETEKYIYNGKFHKRSIRTNPGLLKIIDEVITNSVDVAIKSNFKTSNKIKVFFDGNKIIVEDNGTGIPVVLDEKTKKYAPELVFTNLKTGSNFDDDSESESAGVNGVGVSLTNIFSKHFTIETNDGKHNYIQTYENHCRTIFPPKIKKTTKKGTIVSFLPDYDYFKCTKKFLKDLPILVEKRVKDLSFAYPEIKFYYNGKSVKRTKDLMQDINENHVFIESEKVRLGITKSPNDSFEALGFVNGCEANTGTHINYISNIINLHLKEYIKKKYKIDVKPFDIKKHLLILIALRMPKPIFSNQTKDELTSEVSCFEDRIDEVLTQRFINKICANDDLIVSIIEIYKLREESKENAKIKSLQKNKKIKCSKYIPAISKNKSKNILFIGEGDSALSSFTEVREPHMAAIPIRGKFINVFGMHKIKVLEKEEARTLMQVIGLKFDEPANNINFGEGIAILSDQDHDGNAIAGLLLNFFMKFWPELIENGLVIRVLSPLFIVRSTTEVHKFYNHQDYYDFEKSSTWRTEYNKGLGGLQKEDYREVLTELKHIKFEIGNKTKETLKLVYCDDSGPRKEWLSEK